MVRNARLGYGRDSEDLLRPRLTHNEIVQIINELQAQHGTESALLTLLVILRRYLPWTCKTRHPRLLIIRRRGGRIVSIKGLRAKVSSTNMQSCSVPYLRDCSRRCPRSHPAVKCGRGLKCVGGVMQEDRTGLVYQYERTRRAETQGLQGEFIPRIFLFVTFKQVGHQRHLKRI